MSTTNKILEDHLPKYSKDYLLDQNFGNLDRLADQIDKTTNPFLATKTLNEVKAIDKEIQKFSKTFESRKIHTVFQKILTQNKARIIKFPSSTVSLDPPMPKASNALDPIKFKQWKAAHSNINITIEGTDIKISCRKTVEALGECISQISLDSFLNAFQKSIQHFNTSLEKASDKDYTVVTASEKSNEWMFQIALPNLANLPTDSVDINKTAKEEQEILVGYSKWAINHDVPKKIVLFDDVSYSGMQLTKIIKEILTSSQEKQKIPEEIHIVCAYITTYGKKRVEHCLKGTVFEKQCQITFHEPENIPTITEAIQKKFTKRAPAILGMLRKMYWPNEPNPEAPNQDGPDSRSPSWFKHKVPDGISFPSALADGAVYNSEGAEELDEEDNPKYDLIQFIPTTIPPYYLNDSYLVEIKK